MSRNLMTGCVHEAQIKVKGDYDPEQKGEIPFQGQTGMLRGKVMVQ